MYADDTSLCSRSKDLKVLNGTLNEDLQRLVLWLQGNKLSECCQYRIATDCLKSIAKTFSGKWRSEGGILKLPLILDI